MKIMRMVLFACTVAIGFTVSNEKESKADELQQCSVIWSDLGLFMREQCMQNNSARACDNHIMAKSNMEHATRICGGTKYSKVNEPANYKIKNMTRIKIESGEYSGKEFYILTSQIN